MWDGPQFLHCSSISFQPHSPATAELVESERRPCLVAAVPVSPGSHPLMFGGAYGDARMPNWPH